MKKLFRIIGVAYLVLYVVACFSILGDVAIASHGERGRDIVWNLQSSSKYGASIGDYMVVDISNGIGYLMNNLTKNVTIFPVMTGGKRTPTPEQEWVVKEKNIQGNRIFFGESGEFLRLYTDAGEQFTHYGIHGYAYFDREIERGTKYLSWGCVMTSDDVLDLIEESYLANGGLLKVTTVDEVNLSNYFVEFVRGV